jgi:magnesium transporter
MHLMDVPLDAARPFGRLLNRRQRIRPALPGGPPAGLRAFLYDAESTDRPVGLDAVDADSLTGTQLLWVDVADVRELPSLAAAFRLTDETIAAIEELAPEPSATVFDGYVHIAVTAPGSPIGDEPQALHCLIGANWVVTAHARRIEWLERFDERIRTDSELGRIDAHDFLAAILQEQVASYLTELRPIEAELDRIDVQTMTGRIGEEALLRELVGARIRLTRLRRLLEPHRELYARLSRSEFAVLAGSNSAAEFQAVTEFLERVLNSMESTREMIVGSFEVYTTWSAHSTNRLIRRLTVASVTILPPTLLAGIMGMNSLPENLTNGSAFWLTIAVMAGLALGVVTVALRRDWL